MQSTCVSRTQRTARIFDYYWLIWMQYVKRVCGKKNLSGHQNFSNTVGEINGSETFSGLTLFKFQRLLLKTFEE